jgi:hypothetical protein
LPEGWQGKQHEKYGKRGVEMLHHDQKRYCSSEKKLPGQRRKCA